MDERKTAAPRIASRTAVMAAVAVLIVIAIAGIVLASLRRAGPGDAATGTDSTQASAPAPTAAALAADDSPPGELVFAPGSDQLSAVAQAKVALLAAEAKKDGRSVVVATKIEANGQRKESMDLAKRRAYNVRGALTSGGVSLGMMRIEVTELPVGLVPPRMAQRVEVVMR